MRFVRKGSKISEKKVCDNVIPYSRTSVMGTLTHIRGGPLILHGVMVVPVVQDNQTYHTQKNQECASYYVAFDPRSGKGTGVNILRSGMAVPTNHPAVCVLKKSETTPNCYDIRFYKPNKSGNSQTLSMSCFFYFVCLTLLTLSAHYNNNNSGSS